MDNLFSKFSTHSKNALRNAFDIALSSGHKSVSPQHILYGLSREKGSIASQILNKVKVQSTELKINLLKSSPSQNTVTQINLIPNTKKLLEKSFLIANSHQHKYIGTEHLLASVISIKDHQVEEFFRQKNINRQEIQRQIETIFNSTSKFPDITGSFGEFDSDSGEDFYSPQIKQKNSLELFATNLTDPALQENIDPVIGRQEEIDRLIQILARRNKNNPLLLGDPGVGKTAIVEGLAKKIIQGEVPEILTNKKIYNLDLSLVVAGTSFRGEFENRLKQIIKEVKKNPNIILFIDEIHNIIGVGSATGSMDAANILKPALARGEIRCIGATTTEEYKKYIESDPALERRFQTIMVNETSVDKTIEILQGIKNNYEEFHQVKIENNAIKAAVTLSERYIADRFLPDKAIDLIDEAASAVKIKNLSNPLIKELWNLENSLQLLDKKKQEAVSKEKFSLALKHKEEEEKLLEKLSELKKKRKNLKQKYAAKITETDIAGIISKITGIPSSELMLKEKSQLLNLENSLGKKVIDQNMAVKSIAEFIRRSRTGIADANRPIGSFIFLGPSGVGKTELAKVLAETVFGSEKALIKIDMSEFAESFNISKLIGAPAGYVGYKEGAKLTDSIKYRPYSVVLLDEIEKAHRQIFNLMLQILDEGCLTDATGKKINFKNSIIIMTSNLGSETFNRQAALGFDPQDDDKKTEAEKSFNQTEKEVLKNLKDKFPPEFLSRIDKTIVFKPLTKKAVTQISKLQLQELKNRLIKQDINLKIEPNVYKIIAQTSYSPEIGAREIRKNIQELIESKIAQKILSSKVNNKKFTVRAKEGKIIV